MRRTLHGPDFLGFRITYEKKKMECSSEFFNFIPIDLRKSSQLLGTNLKQCLLKFVGSQGIQCGRFIATIKRNFEHKVKKS